MITHFLLLLLYCQNLATEDTENRKMYKYEALAKIVTPVKTGVQRYLNLLEITGFRLSPE